MKNEERAIASFLDGILAQSRPPDQVVLVDGGSSDNTVETVQSYIVAGAPLVLISAPGASRSRARNLATQAANYDVIACTDVGCVPKVDWLQRLIAPFSDPAVEAVGGFYRPDCHTRFEVCAGVATCPALEHIDVKTWMPTTRSLAYKRSAWALVGGFDDDLFDAEDAPFVASLRRAQIKWGWALDAVVLWRPRSTLVAFARQHTHYAYGDGQSATHVRPHLTLLGLYLSGSILAAIAYRYRRRRQGQLVGTALVVASSGYYMLRMSRSWRRSPGIRRGAILFGLTLCMDSGLVAFLVGSLRRWWRLQCQARHKFRRGK